MDLDSYSFSPFGSSIKQESWLRLNIKSGSRKVSIFPFPSLLYWFLDYLPMGELVL